MWCLRQEVVGIVEVHIEVAVEHIAGWVPDHTQNLGFAHIEERVGCRWELGVDMQELGSALHEE